jgi:hypothetical protein
MTVLVPPHANGAAAPVMAMLSILAPLAPEATTDPSVANLHFNWIGNPFAAGGILITDVI